MLARGIKKQVLGGVLFCLGAMTVLLSRTIGFELDAFYIAVLVVGAGLYLYGLLQTRKNMLTREPQLNDGSCKEPDATDGIPPHLTDMAV